MLATAALAVDAADAGSLSCLLWETFAFSASAVLHINAALLRGRAFFLGMEQQTRKNERE